MSPSQDKEFSCVTRPADKAGMPDLCCCKAVNDEGGYEDLCFQASAPQEDDCGGCC